MLESAGDLAHQTNSLDSGSVGNHRRGPFTGGLGGTPLPPLISASSFGANGTENSRYQQDMGLRRSLMYQDSQIRFNHHQAARALDSQQVPASLRNATGAMPSSSFNAMRDRSTSDILQDSLGGLSNDPGTVPAAAAFSRIAELENELWQYRQMRARIRLSNPTNSLGYDDMNSFGYYPSSDLDSLTAGGPTGYQSQLDRRDLSQLGINGFPSSSSYQQQLSLISDRQGMSGVGSHMPPLLDPNANGGMNMSFHRQQAEAERSAFLEESKVRQQLQGAIAGQQKRQQEEACKQHD